MRPRASAQRSGAAGLRRDWPLCDLLSGIAPEAEALPAHPRIAALTLDSRTVRPGSLFIALRGARGHGMDYAAQAAAQGAAAILSEREAGVERPLFAASAQGRATPVIVVADLAAKAGRIADRFYGAPSARLKIAAVTGANGKSTVAWLLAQARPRSGLIGTLGGGLMGALRPTGMTTPDAPRLHEMLAELCDAGATHAALEASSHGLAQRRLDGVRIDVALFTNLSRDHLDYHGDMTRYAAAKRTLFDRLAPRAAAINADDPFGRELLAQSVCGTTVAFRLAPDGRDGQDGEGQTNRWNGDLLRGRVIAQGPAGATVAVESPWGSGNFRSSLIGRFNFSNQLAALTALLLQGVALEEAMERIARPRPIPGRMERFGGGPDAPLAIVDYAHTPDALAQALRAVRETLLSGADAADGGGRLWCVFGCGGERDRGKRAQMGEAAERLADEIILTDDNPRGEDGLAITAEIRGGMRRPQRALVIRGRGQAIRHALEQAAPADCVLIAGKGHETEQRIGDLRIPFSDRDCVRRLLRERIERTARPAERRDPDPTQGSGR